MIEQDAAGEIAQLLIERHQATDPEQHGSPLSLRSQVRWMLGAIATRKGRERAIRVDDSAIAARVLAAGGQSSDTALSFVRRTAQELGFISRGRDAIDSLDDLSRVARAIVVRDVGSEASEPELVELSRMAAKTLHLYEAVSLDINSLESFSEARDGLTVAWRSWLEHPVSSG